LVGLGNGAEQLGVGGLVDADNLVRRLLLDLLADLAREFKLETAAEAVVLENWHADGVNLPVVVGLRGVTQEGEILRTRRQEQADERKRGASGRTSARA